MHPHNIFYFFFQFDTCLQFIMALIPARVILINCLGQPSFITIFFFFLIILLKFITKQSNKFKTETEAAHTYLRMVTMLFFFLEIL